MRKPIYVLVAFAIVLALGLSACAQQAAPAAPTKAPESKPAATQAPAAATQAPAAATQAPAATAAPKAAIPPTQLRLMTGPMGGSWYPLGGAIAEILKTSIPGMTVDVQPGAGITNIKAVEAGKADIGLANACSAADALAGRQPFEGTAKNVFHLATLYDQFFQMVAPEDTGIKTVADFKGKRLTTQQVGNTGEQMTRHVMEVYGLSYSDLAKPPSLVNYNDSVNLIKDRQAEVFALVTTVPAPSITELTLTRKMRLIGITDEDIAKLQKINSGYGKKVIPKGSYEGQTEDVVTYGTYTHLIVSGQLSEDVVYAITKALAQNIKKMGEVVADVKALDVKGMASDVGVPLHPGALKYYKEVGAR